MRADNHGEGGILALLALLPDFLRRTAKGKATLPAVLILIGAGLLYGDGVLTPAISVLSAVEGIGVLDPRLEDLAVPLTCVILLGLFLVQSRGTALLGRVFGPVMICWFALIGGLGLVEVVKEPSVVKALLPTYAVPDPDRQRHPRVPAARLDHPRGDRRRGALRRHGPLRRPAHPAGMAVAGQAGAGAGLPRPGGDRDQQPGGGREPPVRTGSRTGPGR